MAHILTEKLWYTADKSAVVPDGDPRAAFLLGCAGLDIPDAEAERLGLKGTTPPANKGMTPPANKGGLSFAPEVKESEGGLVSGDELPDDFPAVELLRSAGLATYTAVRAADVTKVKGRQISEALE